MLCVVVVSFMRKVLFKWIQVDKWSVVTIGYSHLMKLLIGLRIVKKFD